MEISDFCHYLLSISKLRHVKTLKPAFREIVPLPPPRCYEFDVKCKSFYKIANILYSEDLSTRDNFLRNGWNDGQTLITKPLYSKHFMVDTSL